MKKIVGLVSAGILGIGSLGFCGKVLNNRKEFCYKLTKIVVYSFNLGYTSGSIMECDGLKVKLSKDNVSEKVIDLIITSCYKGVEAKLNDVTIDYGILQDAIYNKCLEIVGN